MFSLRRGGRPPRGARLPSPILAGFIVLALVITGMTMTEGSDGRSPPVGPAREGLLGATPAEKVGVRVPATVSAAGAAGSAMAPASGFWAPGKPAALDHARELVAAMRDEEVLGQVFMFSYPGEDPPRLLYDWIEKRGLGGVKIFGWNAADTTRLAGVIAELQTAALSSGRSVPLLIATDQEGGTVRHVKGATSETPGNMAIGASGRPYDAYWSGWYIARELDAIGVNMNFAPAVDLATSPRGSLIGVRSFGSDAMTTGILGAAWVSGTMAAGVIPTAKHFPGHGGTDLDSHGILPRIDIDYRTLWERELLPFRMLVGEGLPAVMSGHLAFPRIDPSELPASLSRVFMTEILRTKLGFQGLAVTDDLRMGGAVGDFDQNCRRALEAGNDLVMTSSLPELSGSTWTSLLSAYRAEPRFRTRVREAAARVLALKFEWLLPKGKAGLLPLPEYLGKRVPDPQAGAFFRDQAGRSATALHPELLPWNPKGRLLVASPLGAFTSAASRAWPDAPVFHFSWRPESAALPAELAAFDGALTRADSVLVCVAGEAGMDFALRASEAGKNVAIISLLSPLPLARAPRAVAAVAVYGSSSESIEAGLAAADR
ncbi:MAG: glycoside hydrolase family 3 N-terminal domain-containing protein, partial [Spirochaetota bacterium]